MYFVLAFIIGLDVVLATVLNGKLAEKIGVANGTFVNYLIGFISSIFLCFIMNEKVPMLETLSTIPWYYFLSGFFGLFVVLLFNVTVPNIPAIYIVIIPFIGQMLTSSILDFFYLDTFSKGKIIGVIMFFLGLLYNSTVDKKYAEIDSEL